MPSILPSPRTLLFRLHWALGLTAGLVLSLMGLTGGLMSYEEAITAYVDRDRAIVVSQNRHGLLGPAALLSRIEAQMRDRQVSSLTLSGDPGRSVLVRFARNRGSGERPASVYAHPVDGTVLGPVRMEAAFATVRNLHRWLLLRGEGKGWGRTITGACALALLVFLGSGLYLRWPGRHGWRIWLRPNLARGPGRARWWSLHAVAGTWLLPIYAVFALSGLWWSYEWYRTGATWFLTGQSPEKRSASRSDAGAAGRAFDRLSDEPSALTAAWTHFSQTHLSTLATITVPEVKDATIRIRWYASADGSGGLRNETLYDARTSALVADDRSDGASLGRRIADNMLEVHRGRFFGGLIALLFCLAAIAMPGFFVTGLVLYTLRRWRRPSRTVLQARSPSATL